MGIEVALLTRGNHGITTQAMPSPVIIDPVVANSDHWFIFFIGPGFQAQPETFISASNVEGRADENCLC